MAHIAGRERLPAGERSGSRRVTPSLAIAALLVPLILACGATPVLLKTAPASQLQLQLTFDYTSSQLSEPLPPNKVMVIAGFGPAQHGSPIVLAGGQTLFCDGVDMLKAEDINSSKAEGSVPTLLNRQPPGGAYTCVYTDERGQQTTVVIPAPTGQLAITNPRARDILPVGPLIYPYPYVTPSPTSALAPPPLAHGGLVISYTIPDVPPGGRAVVSAQAGCPRDPNDGAYCYGVAGPEVATQGDGTYLLPNATAVSSFPGATSGYITLALKMDWSPAPQGFQQVHVETRESVTVPVTWTPRINTTPVAAPTITPTP